MGCETSTGLRHIGPRDVARVVLRGLCCARCSMEAKSKNLEVAASATDLRFVLFDQIHDLLQYPMYTKVSHQRR